MRRSQRRFSPFWMSADRVTLTHSNTYTQNCRHSDGLHPSIHRLWCMYVHDVHDVYVRMPPEVVYEVFVSLCVRELKISSFGLNVLKQIARFVLPNSDLAWTHTHTHIHTVHRVPTHKAIIKLQHRPSTHAKYFTYSIRGLFGATYVLNMSHEKKARWCTLIALERINRISRYCCTANVVARKNSFLEYTVYLPGYRESSL